MTNACFAGNKALFQAYLFQKIIWSFVPQGLVLSETCRRSIALDTQRTLETNSRLHVLHTLLPHTADPETLFWLLQGIKDETLLLSLYFYHRLHFLGQGSFNTAFTFKKNSSRLCSCFATHKTSCEHFRTLNNVSAASVKSWIKEDKNRQCYLKSTTAAKNKGTV